MGGGRSAWISLACPSWGFTQFAISAKTFSLQQQGGVQPVNWRESVALGERRFSPTPLSSPPSEYEYDAKGRGEKEEKDGEEKEREEGNFLDQWLTLCCCYHLQSELENTIKQASKHLCHIVTQKIPEYEGTGELNGSTSLLTHRATQTTVVVG